MMTRQMHPRGAKNRGCGGEHFPFGFDLWWRFEIELEFVKLAIPEHSERSRSRSMSKLEWARSVAGMEVKTVLEELNHWFKRNPLLFSIEIIRCDHSMASSSRSKESK
ncbi:hypothetical protein OUZ56_025941 [Daphnia magna]|uniref:Uncharacterized protein n=1 Tax=Daphnia magna TaxID=35525 RepID=A0ABQ9ZKE7_9CRUS|nr:hypothetical protein OUZ56_025941 [Daphnia magna]